MTPLETLHRSPSARPLWPWGLLVSQVLVVAVWWRWGWCFGLPAMVISHACFIVPIFLPRAGLYAPVLWRLPGSAPRVWLTIDDGPSDDTPAMLDLLDAHAARATFFLVGERAARRPELVREILRRGHDIGNHSQHHWQRRFWILGPGAMSAEIGQAQQALTTIAGRPPRWFRSVVGMTNPCVATSLRRHRLTRVAWSARGFDGVDCTPEGAVERIMRDVRPGAIILLHEGAAHGHNREILAGVLHRLKALQLSCVLPYPEQS